MHALNSHSSVAGGACKGALDDCAKRGDTLASSGYDLLQRGDALFRFFILRVARPDSHTRCWRLPHTDGYSYFQVVEKMPVGARRMGFCERWVIFFCFLKGLSNS